MDVARPLLIEGGTVVTMDGGQRVLSVGHVLVRRGRIVAVGQTRPDVSGDVECIDASGRPSCPA